MVSINRAIHSLYPQVASTAGDEAFDAQGNKFEYDVDAVNAEVIRLQAEEDAKAQQLINDRQSALNKLMALGLTEQEALALGVK